MTATQQIQLQQEQGNKTISIEQHLRNSKNGRKVAVKKLQFADITLIARATNKTIDEAVRDWVIENYHKSSTNRYYGEEKTKPEVLQMIANRVNAILEVSGPVIIERHEYKDGHRIVTAQELIHGLE